MNKSRYVKLFIIYFTTELSHVYFSSNLFNFQSKQDKFLFSIVSLLKCKELKKELNEELMPVSWHSNRWWDWCMSVDEKKGIDPFF